MPSESFVGYYRALRDWVQATDAHERTRELLGSMLARQVAEKNVLSSLHEAEFRVHSQFGDDGIIQWLVARLPSLPKRFVEFGVEDYSESNTRFLMVNNNWAGLVLDASEANMTRLRRRKWFWRYDLTARSMFMTRENVDQTIAEWADGNEIGLLHIDVDGNDYWLWDAIRSVQPGIVIMEYNALFGGERAITIPYDPDFRRHAAHYSGQYAGASLAAMTRLAVEKGYIFIGTNSAGNNAYFVRVDFVEDDLRAVAGATTFVKPGFRDSMDQHHRLDYRSYEQRQALIRGLPVWNVASGQVEPF